MSSVFVELLVSCFLHVESLSLSLSLSLFKGVGSTRLVSLLCEPVVNLVIDILQHLLKIMTSIGLRDFEKWVEVVM
jgi:hypothetical protein